MTTPTPDTPPGPESTPPPAGPAGIAFTPLSEPAGDFPKALGAGAVAALIGAAVWAAITYSTESRFGLIAVGIGFIVGYAIRWAGQGGMAQKFAVAGAVLAFLGCALGNFFAICGFIANAEDVPFFPVVATLAADPARAFAIMRDTANLMDVVFYGIAIYEGYKLSRPIVRA